MVLFCVKFRKAKASRLKINEEKRRKEKEKVP